MPWRNTLTLFVLSVAFLSSCTNRASKLQTYSHVPDFTMTDSEGREFHGSSLLGKTWVADFIYTTCPAACPMMSARMKRVHAVTAGQPDLRIVSFSVDPKDTPAMLKAFGQKYGGANQDWIFLAGDPGTIHQLAFTTFHVGDILGKIEHSTKFILVDKRGNIRGYYSSLGEDGIPELIKDLEALRKD